MPAAAVVVVVGAVLPPGPVVVVATVVVVVGAVLPPGPVVVVAAVVVVVAAVVVVVPPVTGQLLLVLEPPTIVHPDCTSVSLKAPVQFSEAEKWRQVITPAAQKYWSLWLVPWKPTHRVSVWPLRPVSVMQSVPLYVLTPTMLPGKGAAAVPHVVPSLPRTDQLTHCNPGNCTHEKLPKTVHEVEQTDKSSSN